MKDLKSELSKNLERLIIGLMLTPAEFDAKMMRKAMEVKTTYKATATTTTTTLLAKPLHGLGRNQGTLLLY